MERRTSDAMRHIRRAAVTGLFAIWLAPLSAVAEAPNGPAYRADRPMQAERAAVENRRDQDDDHADTAPEPNA
ncbi:hypothetical protein [Neoroseomonas lacus]|uniref:Uncharacterized protein n=1 Tax=Neoroseomonas lacus TaxID=287609 RepID=A0A917KTY7_9PROT|nr:hypothetical protein [Neoroseomonas lacus]GGJ26323.1 hypothetical protein GCM10011320_37240 [Neoroseomonas lacus]